MFQQRDGLIAGLVDEFPLLSEKVMNSSSRIKTPK